MRKDDQGLAPHGGILLDDAAAAASGEAVRQQPAASPEAGPGIATEGGGAIAEASGGRAEPVTGPGPGSAPDRSPAVPAETRPQPVAPRGGPVPQAPPAETRPQPVVPPQTAQPPQAAQPSETAEPPATPEGPALDPEAAGPPPIAANDSAPPAAPAGSDARKDPGEQAPVAVRASGVVVRPVTATPEPSLAKVLATTIKLWTSRRLRKIGIGRRHPAYPGAGGSYREPAAPTRTRTVWRWRLAAIVLAVAILALVALQLSGVLNKSGSSAGPAAKPGNGGASSLSAAAATRDEAAAWVAQQVGNDNIIACDPVVCSALLGRGIPAGRLLPLQSAGANPFGADVIVASPPVRSEYGGELTNVYAPGLIASFGAGATRVDIRAIASQGGAAYRAAEQPDLNARKAAGAQLLHNPHFHATALVTGQITAGQVDSRLLVTLASLVSQRSVSVSSFGDTGPGAPVQFRQVMITSSGGQDSALTADLYQVQTQRTPYLPENANIVHPGGPAVLRIEFGAPSLQGLLTGGNSS